MDAVQWRTINNADIEILVILNRQLQEDSGINTTSVEALEWRMRERLATGYDALVLSDGEKDLGYCMYHNEEGHIIVDQFFIVRNRPRERMGTHGMHSLMRDHLGNEKPILVRTPSSNESGIAFLEHLGAVPAGNLWELSPIR